MTFLEQKIRDAHTAGRTALIPFVTAGFPTLDTFWGIIEELDANGADVIEIGVPFSDPVADGPVVEDASRRALEQGVSLNWIMDGLKQRAGNFKAGIVLMGYLNPFLQYGLERFAADAAQAGVSGCIVPDLPLDESAPVRTTLKAHGIDLIALVGQNTSEERMREYAAISEGYVYVVSVLGTTGARTGLPPQVEETLRRARKAFNLPLALVKMARDMGLDIPQMTDNPMMQKIDLGMIMQLIESGVIGKLVEVDSANGDHVEVIVE